MPPKRKNPGPSASTGMTVDLTLIDDVPSATSERGSAKQLCAISAIAKQCTCPISQELMIDPVIAEDGNTYDRERIER